VKRTALRRMLGVVVVLLMILLFWDLSRPPGRQWSARMLLMAIDLYQASLSPQMEIAGVRCRFEPTCSHYAEAVIRRDGALLGSWRAGLRVARCGPWTPAGTRDQP
jgi:putative membrane protein insertion efficiency factor